MCAHIDRELYTKILNLSKSLVQRILADDNVGCFYEITPVRGGELVVHQAVSFMVAYTRGKQPCECIFALCCSERRADGRYLVLEESGESLTFYASATVAKMMLRPGMEDQMRSATHLVAQ